MGIRERFWDQDAALLAVASAPDGILTEANPGWGSALGWSLEQLVGRNLADLVVVRDPATPRRYSWPWPTPASPRSGPWPAPARPPVELTMTYAPIGMTISRLDGRWIAINPTLCRLLGRSQDELLGGLWFADLTHPDDLEREAPLLDELLAGTRNSYPLDKRYRHPDGLDVWTTTAVTLVRDTEGTPRHDVGPCLDITERRRTEKELRDAAARLQASDKLRLAFLRATSHELRTPLTAVLGLADTLRRLHQQLPAEQVDLLLDRLSANAQRLEALIEHLLDVDRMSIGLLEAAREPVLLDRLDARPWPASICAEDAC